MKNILPIASLVAALLIAVATPVSAQLSWGSGGAGGSGTWDSITSNWFNGSFDQAWVSGDTGTFAGTAGTVTLSGTQTASQLAFSNVSGTYTLTGGALGIGSGSNFIVQTNRDAIINSNINILGSTGTLTKTGTSTLTLGGTNTFTTLAINSGVVAVNTVASSGAQPLGNGSITLGVAGTSSGTLSYADNSSATTHANITASGNGNDTITLGGTSILTISGTTTINGPSLTLTSTILMATSGPPFFTPIPVQGIFVFNKPILAAAGSVLNVNAVVTLNTPNSNVQTINITGTSPSAPGVLFVEVNNALPSTVSITMNNGNLNFGAAGALTQTVANLSGKGQILAENSSGTTVLTINNTTDDAFNGSIIAIYPTGSMALIKSGTGTFALTSNSSNTYTGGTTINSGAVVISRGTSTSSGTISGGALGTGSISLNDGGTLEDSGTFITLANSLAVSGTVTFASTGAGSLTFDGSTLITPSTFQITGTTNMVTNNNVTIADSVSNSGNYNLIKSGSGTLFLTGSGSSSGTGSTTVTAGALVINDASNLGSGTVTLSGSTSLQYTGGTGTFTQAITVSSGSGTLINSGFGTVLTLNGTLNIDGSTLTVTGTSTNSRFVISGPITGPSSNSNINFKGGRIGLTSTSTYNGSTSLIGGDLLLLGIDNALPNGTALIFGATGESGFSNQLDLLGHSITVSSLSMLGTDSSFIYSSNGSATTPAISGTPSATTGNLTVNLASGTDSYGGGLGVIAPGNFSLTKSGTGTLALTRATGNIYTGGTIVTAGTLTISNTRGSATGTGTINISSGAALTGSGTITSTHIAISGNLQPGMGGSDTTGIMTLTSTSTAAFTSANLVFNLNATTPGQSNELVLNATPSVLFTTSTLTLNLLNGTPSSGISEYTLMTSTTTGSGVGGSVFGGDISYDSSTGIISGLNLTFNTSGYSASYLKLVSNGSGGYNLDVEIQAVPEPGSWMLLLGSLGLLGFCRVRKRRQTGAGYQI